MVLRRPRTYPSRRNSSTLRGDSFAMFAVRLLANHLTAWLRAPRARHGPVARRLRAMVILATLLTLTACKRSYSVGEKVLVEWEGNVYPAVIREAPGPTKFKVHYDGYDEMWDEVISRDKIKGLVEGTVVQPEPPPKVRAKAIQAAQTNVYKLGDRVRVEWHGQIYPALINGIVGQERYRIHYEGYGNEWDETVGLSRIQPK